MEGGGPHAGEGGSNTADEHDDNQLRIIWIEFERREVQRERVRKREWKERRRVVDVLRGGGAPELW